jgi:hypothetical protein
MHMETAFDIRRSNKHGIDSQEHYVVTKGGIVFLRVIRDEQQQYELVTATAGEDTGQFHPYPDKKRLLEAALRTSARLGTQSRRKADRKRRKYIVICDFALIAGARYAAEKFFEVLDEISGDGTQSQDEMRDIYEALAIDDSGADVYVSDGVWLGRDGTLDDRGR